MRLSFPLLIVILLLLSIVIPSITAFNPYDSEDESGSGVAPSTSTLRCTIDPSTGVESCESISHEVLNEDELDAKIAAAEEERREREEVRAAAKRVRDEKYETERQAKRDARQAEADARAKANQEKGGNNKKTGGKKVSADDYKIAEPIKRLKVNYYKFFGVEQDEAKLKIRKVVNQMALANHPDKCPAGTEEETTKCGVARKEKMIIINQAKDVLLDDETRAEYDFLLRFGFKVYDKELYNDMKKSFDNDEPMPTGFRDDEGYDPASDRFESMDLTEESAGWLLLLTGLVTLGMIAVPVYKFYGKRGDADAKKASVKREMANAQSKATATLTSLKKKYDKSNSETNNGPKTSPRANGGGVKSTATIALVCAVALIAMCAPVTAITKPTVGTYYNLLDVNTNVDELTLKKAYRSLALKFHPDRFTDRPLEQEMAAAKFISIAEAVKRVEYDVLLNNGHLTYDARAYAELMAEKNVAWGQKAGYTFTRRRPSGPPSDDSWVVYLVSAFVLFGLSIPAYKLYYRYVASKSKIQSRREANNELKLKLSQQQKAMKQQGTTTTTTTTGANKRK